MKKILIIALNIICFSLVTNAQIKIGDNVKIIDPNSLLEIEGIGKTVVLPRMLSTAVPATPLYGSIVYATDLKCIYFFDGTKWNCLAKPSQGYNTKFYVAQDSLFITDSGSKLSVPLKSLIDTTSLSKRIDSLKKSLADSTKKLTDSLKSHIAADKDIDSLNEVNTAFALVDTNLSITDKHGKLTVSLKSIKTDTASLSARIDSMKKALVDSTKKLTDSLKSHIAADKDIDSTNEKIKSFAVAGDSLTLVENNTTFKVPLSGLDATKANNGLTKTKDTIQLGGDLIKPTTIGTSATNTIAFTGLQTGVDADSLMVVSTNGVVKKVKFAPTVVTTASNYTVLPEDDIIIFNGTAASTITLPAASASKDRVIQILNYANSATNVDLTFSTPIIYEGNSTSTVLSSRSSMSVFSSSSTFGMTSNTLSSVSIVSNGTSWYKLGN